MEVPTARSAAVAAARELAVPGVAGVATGLPEHHYRQRDLAELAHRFIGARKTIGSVERFFDRVGVTERYLALPAHEYAALSGLEQRNDAWIRASTSLGQRVIAKALAGVGLRAADIGLFVTTSVTGIAVPSIDARLMNLLPFAPSTKRMPLFGLGCLGGAAGLARTAEYLRAFPDQAALFLSVELCSLTFQPDDGSVANLISTGLFGDGAAAVVLVGPRHPLHREVGRPRVVASRSVFFPNTERVMGWDVVDSGFKIVLSADVPKIVSTHVPGAVDDFLAEHGLGRRDITSWIMHPGGPKVIDAMQESLGLSPADLQPTRDSLSKVGNLSSASVLFLLDEHSRRAHERGSYAVLMAMGPAFCAEIVLLQW
ncbi:MAG: type III polyketide synthase [Polyangiaceae bacterium]|nr:type III polyketide synthase [Polyangiaceae bacterium]